MSKLFDTLETEEVKHDYGSEVGKVYKTDDYSLFKLSKFNRNVILKKEMLNQAREGLISPIIVNEDFVVIDGQHRFTAAKEVKVPIEYIVKPGLGKHDIVRMNTIQRKWSMVDYVEAFANQGLNEYIRLAELIKSNIATSTEVAMISLNNLSSSSTRSRIEDGSFRFANYDKAVEFLEYYARFKKETGTPKRASVALGLWTLFQFEKVDRDRIIRKIISTGLNEEIKIKNYNRNEFLKSVLESYNKQFNYKSAGYINYIITSNGTIVIREELSHWAKVWEVAN